MRSLGLIVLAAGALASGPAVTLAADAEAKALTLPTVIGDHMVLQQGMPAPIWGWAEPGEKVTVTFAGQKKIATVEKNGKWMVRLDPLKASDTPREMVISSSIGPQQSKIGDVLVGEVWLCAGQSNMERGLHEATTGGKAIDEANHPKIRWLRAPRRRAAEPQPNVEALWEVCSPESAEGFCAVPFFFGRDLHKGLKVPVGLLHAAWGGSAIQPWTHPVGYGLVPAFVEGRVKNRGRPDMFNGMVHPFVPFAIRGVTWYQGESNVPGAWTYHERLKALIRGWRKVWGQKELPFYYVQIAPCTNYKPGMLPLLWEGQTKVLSEPKTGMVVITDTVGKDIDDWHPANKEPVGGRLALMALSRTYGRKGAACSFPRYRSMTIRGDRAFVRFLDVGGGLASRDAKPLSWFTIAGEDRKFVEAEARVVPAAGGGVADTVEVHSDRVAAPVAVRFGWNMAAQPNLVNKEGFPASPFRTDKW